MTKILLVHGINNENNTKATIEQDWGDAIRSGVNMPDNASITAAFYGDVLHRETESWGQNEEVAAPMSAGSPDEDYADDGVAAFYLELQRAHSISDEDVAQFLDEGEKLEHARRMAKGVHKRWLKALARALENVLPTKGKFVARAFLGQAAAYLQKPGLKKKIDGLVVEQLFDDLEAEDDVIVISHPLGTVVSYEILRRLRNKVKAKLLLTMGSPLGIQIVQNRLGPPLVCLPNVAKWVNASDPEDFVALRPSLTKQNFGCGNIENIDDLDNGEEDAHDVLMYLQHQVVSQAIADQL